MGLRDRFGKLSSKLTKSRATSPAPPASASSAFGQHPPEVHQPTPQPPESLPERLWNEAYDELKNSESKQTIVEAYEKVLSSQLQPATVSSDGSADVPNIVASDPNARWRQMERLVQVGLEKTAKDADRKQKVNQWLEMINPLKQAISTGIKAAPQAAVPWAGICCALEILSSPLTEPKKNRDGMTHVLTRMEWYWELSRLLLDEDRPSNSSRPLQAQLEKHVISLYGKLLLYEMKSVVLYHRSRFGVFMRDLPKLDDWETQLNEIKDAESAVERDASQYNTLEMRTTLQDISASARVSERKLHDIFLEHKQQDAWQRKDRLEEKDNECLRDLRITNPQDDKETIVKAKGGLLTESYRWVIENESYKQWIKDNDNRLLWIKGNPGKGKTMLISGIINELQVSAPDNVFYFFCQAAEPRLRTATAVLRGLIWFLARTRPDLISYIRKEYDQAGKEIFSDHNAWQALSNILSAMLDDETTDGCMFVIDALDECTVDRDELITLVCRLSSAYKSKWIVSSRNCPEIEAQLDGVTSKLRLHLELNHAAITNAVQNFVTRKVEDLAKKKRYTESIRDAVQKHLLSNANDTFLWVSLVCEELGRHDVLRHHTLKVLESFPAGLDKLYQRMIAQVLDSRDKDICKAILAVVTVAFEPLTLTELAVSDGRLAIFDSDLETLSSIVYSCGSFFAIRDNVVYAVHQSVNDFLQTVPDIFPSGLAQQHYSVFLSSMDIMQRKLHRDFYSVNDTGLYLDEILKPPSSPLDVTRYSCIYWVDHLHKSTSEAIQSPSTRAAIELFLNTKYLYWLESMSLLRCVSVAIKAIRKLGSDLLETAPNKLKTFVEDALRFALTHRAILDAAPLQLYVSALIFSPARSKVRQTYENEMSLETRVMRSSFQDWDACLFTIPGISRDGGLCFSPDGGRLAITHQDERTILIVDTVTGETVRTMKRDQGEMAVLAFSSDGQHLVTATRPENYGNYTIMTWNTNTCECVQTFECGFGILEITSDERFLVLIANLGFAHVWNPFTGSCEYTLDLRHDEVRIEWINCGIMKSGDLCFISVESTRDLPEIVVRNLETGDVISRASFGAEIGFREAALDPGRKRLVIIDYYYNVWLWDAQTPSDARRIIGDGVLSFIGDITWTLDGQSLAISTSNGTILWNLAKQAQIARISSGYVHDVRYGSGTRLASLESGSLKMWRVGSESNESVSVDEQTSKAILKITAGPNEQLRVERGYRDEEFLSTATGNTLCRFHIFPSHPGSVVFGPDYHFAFVDKDGFINIHDTQSGSCLHRLRGHTNDDGYIAIEFESSGQLVSGNHKDGRIRIWDANTGECLSAFGSSSRSMGTRIALSINGRIAITDGEGDIEIWDSRCEEKEKILKNISNWIWSLSFSSNDLLAVCHGMHRNLKILNVSQGTYIGTYLLDDVPYAKFDASSDSRVDVGYGVLDLDLTEVKVVEEEVENENGSPPIWNQQFLRLALTDTEAWLMKGSKRVLWIPRRTAAEDTFVMKPNFQTGASVVSMVHDSHLLILRFGGS